MSHRCEVHRQLVGLDSTIDLYLTIGAPSSKEKATRGALRKGLVPLFTSRLRGLLYGTGKVLFAPPPLSGKMHTTFEGLLPEDIHATVIRNSPFWLFELCIHLK
jgi:hypothetical protein